MEALLQVLTGGAPRDVGVFCAREIKGRYECVYVLMFSISRLQ